MKNLIVTGIMCALLLCACSVRGDVGEILQDWAVPQVSE